LATRRKPTAHLSTFGLSTPKKSNIEKPKELKFLPTLEKRTNYEFGFSILL